MLRYNVEQIIMFGQKNVLNFDVLKVVVRIARLRIYKFNFTKLISQIFKWIT